MKRRLDLPFVLGGLSLFLLISVNPGICVEEREKGTIDEKVKGFLDSHRTKWRDWNVPYSDGKVLRDLILKRKYTRALEIGTSTGHSAIWMAWALSKTGGKLITIEIDEGRYKEALSNFREAGVAGYIDARLGDAHDLVVKLPGPFDFVFSDADKEWYKKYFMLLAPKLEVGGCFVAHNASNTEMEGIREFLDYVKAQKNFKTLMDTSSSSGMSISYKMAAQ
jgi:caffeoyl-CoA O-methyltransferase